MFGFFGPGLNSAIDNRIRHSSNAHSTSHSIHVRKVHQQLVHKPLEHLIKDFIDEDEIQVVDASVDTSKLSLQRMSSHYEFLFGSIFSKVLIANKYTAVVTPWVSLHPNMFHIPDKMSYNSDIPKYWMVTVALDKMHVRDTAERLAFHATLDKLGKYFISRLEEIKKDTGNITATQNRTVYVDTKVEKKHFCGLVTKHTIKKVPITQPETYISNRIDGIELRMSLLCTFNSQNSNTADKIVNVSIDGYDTLEEFVYSIVKSKQYRLTLEIDRFEYKVRSFILCGIYRFKCIKIETKPPESFGDLPPPYMPNHDHIIPDGLAR